MRTWIVLLIIFYQFNTFAGDRFNTGFSIGVSFSFGSHVNQLGIRAASFYGDYFYQVNCSFETYYNFTELGGRSNYFSTRTAIGGAITWGYSYNNKRFEINTISHQSMSSYALGYSYIWYWDRKETSQKSGSISLHLKDLTIAMENDFLAGKGRDRFRTGHVQFKYSDTLFSVAAGVELWTGETRQTTWNKKSKTKMPNGYRDLSNTPYGNTSHGIAYAQIKLNIPYQQTASFKIGYDSENIRHLIQNRLMHDLMFLPKKIKRNTPHYPRIGIDGQAVFESSEIKKSKFLYQFGANKSW